MQLPKNGDIVVAQFPNAYIPHGVRQVVGKDVSEEEIRKAFQSIPYFKIVGNTKTISGKKKKGHSGKSKSQASFESEDTSLSVGDAEVETL